MHSSWSDKKRVLVLRLVFHSRIRDAPNITSVVLPSAAVARRSDFSHNYGYEFCEILDSSEARDGRLCDTRHFFHRGMEKRQIEVTSSSGESSKILSFFLTDRTGIRWVLESMLNVSMDHLDRCNDRTMGILLNFLSEPLLQSLDDGENYFLKHMDRTCGGSKCNKAAENERANLIVARLLN